MQQFIVSRIEWGLDGYEIRFRNKAHNTVYMPKPVEFFEYDGKSFVDPLMKVSEEGMQTLMNEMWIAGIRPSDKLVEPRNLAHLDGEISWLRKVAEHLMKLK